MIVTFCGHSDFIGTKEYEEKLLSVLEKAVGNKPAQMYLGGYGGFDEFAFNCCKKYKENHPEVSLIFVTPYLTLEYQKNNLEYKKALYYYILYPPIENIPMRFAIIYRNRYMVDSADFIIAYINHTFGGAYRTFKYAVQKNKLISNIGSLRDNL